MPSAVPPLSIGKAPIDELLKKENPWRGFDDERSPVLLVTRVERIEGADCAKVQDALLGGFEGERWNPDAPDPSRAAWEPWTKDDLGAIEKCDKSPCDVKLDKVEGALMGATQKSDRFLKYLDIIKRRVARYVLEQKRREYEFPGDPVDPWAEFEKLGFRSAVRRPGEASLYARKLDLAPKKMRPIRQVMDVRKDSVPGLEATMWVRDAYTDHYFDGWGEWRDARCDRGGVQVTLALLLEFDLLKNTDFFSKVSRPSMKKAVKDLGRDYLNRVARKIQDTVTTPEPSGSPSG